MPNETKGHSDESRNEGEGNKTAARHYNEAQHKFAKSGKVDKAAEKARRALDSDEASDLEQAEEEGRSHTKEEDPRVAEDLSKGSH
jgi:hypothetical protein